MLDNIECRYYNETKENIDTRYKVAWRGSECGLEERYMKTKTTKRVFRWFSYGECDRFAEYLNRQSKNGWHFRGYRIGLVFEKGKPEDRIYSVEVFPKGQEFDRQADSDALEYADYCAAAGWTLVDSWRKFCVFCREEEDAVPIVSPEEKLTNIWKAEMREPLTTIVWVLVYAILAWLFTFGGQNTVWITDDVCVFSIFVAGVLGVLSVVELAALGVWYYVSKRTISGGGKVRYAWKKVVLTLAAYIGLFGLYAVGVIERRGTFLITLTVLLICLVLRDFVLNVWRPSRTENRTFRMVFSIAAGVVAYGAVFFGAQSMESQSEYAAVQEDAVPLVQAEYLAGHSQFDSAVRKNSKGILAEQETYRVMSHATGETQDELIYSIYQSNYEKILDLIWNANQKRTRNQQQQDCGKIYGNPVFKATVRDEDTGFEQESYYIRYPGKIVTVFLQQQLEEEQVRQIVEKME